MAVPAPGNLMQYRVQRHFTDHLALEPGNAIEFAPSSAEERKAFDALRASGVIRETHPAHYWFDLDRMGRPPARRRVNKRAVAIVLSFVLAYLFYELYRW